LDYLQQITWRPGIGDPTVMGWVTVGAYAVAAAVAGVAAHRARGAAAPHPGPDRTWLLVAGLMALLCVNKQLDLQSLFTDLGRVLAREQGWYARRREVLP